MATTRKDPRHARARKMRASGMRLARIAEQFGVAPSTVGRWTDPATAEASRAASNEWKARHPEWVTAYRRDRLARLAAARQCDGCGGPVSHTAHYSTCAACLAAAAARRRAITEEMWRAGATVAEIAARIGSTPGSVYVRIAHMRAAGRPLPYRHRRRRPTAVPLDTPPEMPG